MRRKRGQTHTLSNGLIVVNLRKHRGARRMTLSVRQDASVWITLPYWVSYASGKKFAESQREWIQTRVDRLSSRSKRQGDIGSRKHYLKHKEEARTFIHERLEYWNQFYNFTYKRVSVRNQRSLWGSCSSNKNLNFNYALLFLPLELADYVIVHELCHLKELNHGPKFWKLIERTLPEYKKHVKALNGYSKGLS